MSDEAIPLISLTRDLIAFNTVNPPGNEGPCAQYLAGMLEAGGFEVVLLPFEPGRPNLIARSGTADTSPLCFSGHLDTVPLGSARWERDPLGGTVAGDYIYGRGASDMKGGVAAMVHAALKLRATGGDRASLMLALTSGEETGCLGAAALLKADPPLRPAGALIIGEPTSNRPLVGHRGALWLELQTTGKTAHGATPHLGKNAVYRAAEVVRRLESYRFSAPDHPIMGFPTLNVGTISGGLNINSVPDRAVVEVDVRTLPGQSHEEEISRIQSAVGRDVAIRVIQSVEGVATDPRHPWVVGVTALMSSLLNRPLGPAAAPYFTDAAFLAPALGHPPTLILGPGDAAMAHQTDEHCTLSAIRTAADAYFEIGRQWCGI
ncbi:MAG: M20 family metallopeptidase [Desulfobacterales bacterium]